MNVEQILEKELEIAKDHRDVDHCTNNVEGDEIKEETKSRINTIIPVSPSQLVSDSKLCEICQIKPAEHTHHKDHNRKNNKKENLQDVCTLCHAKIHGIEPRFSELKRLVVLYIRTQKARCAIANQIRGFSCIELKVPNFMNALLQSLEQKEKEIEKEIKLVLEPKQPRKYKNKKKNIVGDADHKLDENQVPDVESSTLNNGVEVDHLIHEHHTGGVNYILNNNEKGLDHGRPEYHPVNVCPFPIYKWLKSIKGIAHLLGAKLISYIDLTRTPSAAALRRYSGYGDPDDIKKKGKKICYNPELKTFFHQVANSFIKQGRNHSYIKQYYRPEKAKQLMLLRKMKRKEIINGPKNPKHAHFRAMRFMIKKFINDLYYIMINTAKVNQR